MDKALKSNPMSLPMFPRVLTSAFVVVMLAMTFASCNKEKPTKVIITVKMQDGAPVADAAVRLFANPTYPLGDPTRLNKETTTGRNGTAEFDYTDFYEQGQSGFAVLDIRCTKDTLLGEGLVKILEEETNEETVFLLPAP